MQISANQRVKERNYKQKLDETDINCAFIQFTKETHDSPAFVTHLLSKLKIHNFEIQQMKFGQNAHGKIDLPYRTRNLRLFKLDFFVCEWKIQPTGP